MKPINKFEFEKWIPHADKMCLLDEVVDWDENKIHCISVSHLDPDNPLRSNHILSSICGIEYAAQAMAIHGGLTAMTSKRPKAGYLVSVRDVSCTQARLDDLKHKMNIHAERIMGDDRQVIYQFHLLIGESQIINGRATVILDLEKLEQG